MRLASFTSIQRITIGFFVGAIITAIGVGLFFWSFDGGLPDIAETILGIITFPILSFLNAFSELRFVGLPVAVHTTVFITVVLGTYPLLFAATFYLAGRPQTRKIVVIEYAIAAAFGLAMAWGYAQGDLNL